MISPQKTETQTQIFFITIYLEDLLSLLRIERFSNTFAWCVMELQSGTKIQDLQVNWPSSEGVKHSKH